MNITGVNAQPVLSILQNEKSSSGYYKTSREYKKHLTDEYECL